MFMPSLIRTLSLHTLYLCLGLVAKVPLPLDEFDGWYSELAKSGTSFETLEGEAMSSAVWLPVVLAALLVIGLLLSLGVASFTRDWGRLALSLGTELIGAVVTYLLLERVVRRGRGHRSEKADLIMQLGSSEREVSTAAADELRQRGWLFDGSLQGAKLWGANLQEVDLWGADLQGAKLVMANLQGAKLAMANLRGAILWGTDLQGANLWGANLQEANLAMANLQEAILRSADPQGANLWGAELRDVNLTMANLQKVQLAMADLRGATLPDGETWTTSTDIVSFTDP